MYIQYIHTYVYIQAYAACKNSQDRIMIFAFPFNANYFSHLKTCDYSFRLKSVA